jgi:hypothetical protein
VEAGAEPGGYVLGKTHELTSDNDSLGELMFGLNWPCVKAQLAEAEAHPTAVVVRVESVTVGRKRRR